jgi:cell division protease FtsH
MQLPIEDKHSYSREVLLARITVLMGGRAAEDIIFQTFTTGAGNDIEQATEMARKMVCEWGMSDKMGPLSFGKKDEQIFLGREMTTHKNYSEATAVEIDSEIRKIVDDSYQRALDLLTVNIQNLHNLSACLIEKENLTGAEVDEIIASGSPVCNPEPASGPHTDIQV